jgi:hypothetical protein
VALVVVSAIVALPGPALAVPGYTVHPGGTWRYFHLPGTHGYSVIVSIEGQKVQVEALSRSASASYTVPARSEDGRTVARLGDLGLLSMRFRPSGPFRPTTEPQGDCRGRKEEVRSGHFYGRFSWQGEKGFSSARTKKVPGIVIRQFRQVCFGESAAPGNDRAIEPVLAFRSRIANGKVEARLFGLSNGSFMEAGTAEVRSKLRVERRSWGGGERALTWHSAGHATFTPSLPFLGGAEYLSEAAPGFKWLGDLRVGLPGGGVTSLAGPGFEVVE